MSLFGDDRYQWRETYFVLFREADRPSADAVITALTEDAHYRVSDVRADEGGRFESLTLMSPDDFSAMDVTYVSGDEVLEQVEELLREMAKATLSEDDRAKLDSLGECNSRFDVFHFEQVQSFEDEDEYMDPGALLYVLERLAKLCRGVSVDPQSGTFVF